MKDQSLASAKRLIGGYLKDFYVQEMWEVHAVMAPEETRNAVGLFCWEKLARAFIETTDQPANYVPTKIMALTNGTLFFALRELTAPVLDHAIRRAITRNARNKLSATEREFLGIG